MKHTIPLLSVVVPLYNEAAGIGQFHASLVAVLAPLTQQRYEIIYCDDGSQDETVARVTTLCETSPVCRLVALSKNFGKEHALAAAIDVAQGEAVLLIDGDGQHPVSAIPAFFEAWQQGAQVVIGRRSSRDSESYHKKLFSKLFYRTFGSLTGLPLDPMATDYRLLDREVVTAYRQLAETDRMNRVLIDWLGFSRVTVPIDRHARIAGTAGYSFRKLSRLALDTIVASSSRPLYALCLLGALITSLSLITGVVVGVEQILLRDPLQWKFTGTALLSILIIFFVGILLSAQGVSSLYIATIYNQVKHRPLYLINQRASRNIDHIQS